MKTKKNLITNELRLEMCKNQSENVQRIKENKRHPMTQRSIK